MAKGKSISIFGAKGGTGKTTFVINLAGALSEAQKKVLIVDLDLYNGGVAISLDKPINKTIYNFCDDYNNNRYDDMDTYVIKYNEYIDYLSCPIDPRQANKIDSKYIDILLDKCSFIYDVILVDTTHILDELTVFTLDKTDELLFVTTNDPLDLKNLKNVINILDDADIKKYKIVLNNSVHPDKSYFSLYDIKNILGTNVDYVISSKFHLKNIDSLILDGEIGIIKYPKLEDARVFEVIANNLIKDGVKHE